MRSSKTFFERQNVLSSLKPLGFMLMILCFLVVELSAQTITGRAFLDGNNNGVKDATEPGYPNMVVKAYAPGSSTPAATTTTLNTPLASIGTYSLTGLTAGTYYRIEFTLLNSSGNYYSGPMGTGSKSSVQFATPGDSGVDFGVYFPSSCGSDPDPRVIASSGLFGSMSPDPATLLSYRFSSESKPQDHWEGGTGANPSATHTHSDDVTNSQVGVPWAIARIPGTKFMALATSSSPLTGSMGTGGASGTTAIYVTDYSGAGNSYSGVKTLVQLSSLGFALTADYPIGVDQPRFGEYGLGGIASSVDGKYLYVANLGKGNMIRIDISGVVYASLPATAPTAANITEFAYPASIAGFTSGTQGYFRATAMRQYGGDIYVAGTFDGSLMAMNTAVRVVVLKFNTVTNTFSEVFSYDPTTFDVGNFNNVGIKQGRWTAGPDPITYATPFAPFQPLVSGIDFDDYGAILLGVSDRAVYNLSSNLQAGYIVGTWRNSDGTFSLESAGARGPLVTAHVAAGASYYSTHTVGPAAPSGPAGPGGDVFFDQSLGHPFLYNGGVLNMPGKNTVIAGMADAFSAVYFGVRHINADNGDINRAISLGAGKIFNMVGVDAVCNADPVEIGNLAWLDLNNNGVQDANEDDLPGLVVELLDASNNVIATATTDANGNYLFSNRSGTSNPAFRYGLTQLQPRTPYTVRVPTTATVSSVVYNLTTANSGSNDFADSDAPSTGLIPITAAQIPADGANNHTFDIGYGTLPPCPAIPCGGTTFVKN